MKFPSNLTKYFFVVLLCPMMLSAQTDKKGSFNVQNAFQSEFGTEVNHQLMQRVIDKLNKVGIELDSITIRAFHLYNEKTSGRLMLGLKKANAVADSIRLEFPEKIVIVPVGDDYSITPPLNKQKREQLKSLVVSYWGQID